jgi:hypothetical protein
VLRRLDRSAYVVLGLLLAMLCSRSRIGFSAKRTWNPAIGALGLVVEQTTLLPGPPGTERIFIR